MVWYCRRQNTYPFDASVNQDAEFLAEYLCEGVGYSKVDTASLI